MKSPQKSFWQRIPQGTLLAIFWIEAISATITGLLAIAALACPDWIERALGVAPDRGNGTIEWQLVLASTLSALVFTALAVHSRRRLLIA
jgi:hypothetical protein